MIKITAAMKNRIAAIMGRIGPVVTAVITMVVMCGAPSVAFASDGDAFEKEETVYVVTDSAGVENDVIVSDHLINKNKVDTIRDKTNLSDIENVKGKEKFKQKGEDITWSAGGNDIYYQGRTTAEIPVKLQVKYFLDGKEVSGTDLQGKSGNVTIKIRYTNNAKYNGQTVPMIVMSGLVITDNSFTDIKIDNGKVVNMGDKTVVAGLAAPGLADSVNMSESDLGMGSTVTIRGKANKFAVKDIMTIVTNDVFDNVDTSKLDELDYDSQIKQLDSGAKQLVEGSDELSAGLEQLSTGIGTLAGTSKGNKGLIPTFESLRENVPQLSGAAFAVDDGMKSINTSLGSDDSEKTLIYLANVLDQGLNGVKSSLALSSTASDKAEENVSAAEKNLEAAKSEINSAESKNDDISKTIEENKEALQAIEKGDSNLYEIMKAQVSDDITGDASSKVKSAESQLDSAKSELNTVSEINDELSESLGTAEASGLGTAAAALHQNLIGMKAKISGSKDIPKNQTLLYATGNLNQGLAQMSETITKATDESNPENVIKALETVKSGSSQLSAGSAQLSVGMSKLYKDGIKKIVDLYNNELKGLTSNLSSMVKAGKGYKTFTILPSGMDGNVKFIYKTTINN